MTTLLLKFNDEWFGLLSFLEIACPRLLAFGLKLIFHWNPSDFIFFRSSFKLFADKVISWKPTKKEVSSASSLGLKSKLSEKSLINTEEKRGPRIDPWEPLL